MGCAAAPDLLTVVLPLHSAGSKQRCLRRCHCMCNCQGCVATNLCIHNHSPGFALASSTCGHIRCCCFLSLSQGFSLAVKLGLTKQQVDSLVGIHPTAAEEVVGLKGPDRVVGPSK